MALVALAFAAATRVSDSREGLIAEIITLLGGLAGVSLLIYGLAARRRPSSVLATSSPAPSRLTPRPRSRNDLLLAPAESAWESSSWAAWRSALELGGRFS